MIKPSVGPQIANTINKKIKEHSQIIDEKGFNNEISLRDYLATQAMNAIIIGNNADYSVTGQNGAIGMSKDAYNIADAMLQIRKETLPKV